MKVDGHAKLTNSALRAFRSKCSKSLDIFIRKNICQLPQFNTWNLYWNSSDSNDTDNKYLAKYIILQEFSFLGESTHKIGQGYLTREVVAVDLESPTVFGHKADWGQKYHFMRRAANSTVKNAHKEAVALIKKETINWIRLMVSVMHSHHNRRHRTNSHLILKKRAISHLAVALHSLQDSFSPGHTKRSAFNNPQRPGSIEDIYIYEQQNTHIHSQHDFEAASIHSVHANAAVYASADLLRICALSLSLKSLSPIGWNTFENKWLKLSPRVL